METFKFKHPRRVYLYTLLSFLMCMLGEAVCLLVAGHLAIRL